VLFLGVQVSELIQLLLLFPVFSVPLGIIPEAPLMMGITVASTFQGLLIFLASSRYLLLTCCCCSCSCCFGDRHHVIYYRDLDGRYILV